MNSGADYNWQEEETRYMWASILFVCIYTVEAALKFLGLGPYQYFTSGWNLFDFLVTAVALVGILFQLVNHTFYYVVLLRPLRVLRLFKLKRSFRDVFGTLFIVMSRMVSLAIGLLLLYYFYAIIGMELFSKYDLRNCCVNTSIEDFYRHDNVTNIGGYYYLNSFHNILASGVTLFELTVVNNWHVIMEGYAQVSSEWSRIYFMLFYIIIMIVMNVVVAFILEAFLFRIQYRQTMHVEDMEDHALKREQAELSPEELQMCLRKDIPLTSHFLSQQSSFNAQERNVEDQHRTVFKGERLRSKNDFSLKMYREEVQEWIAEEENRLRSRLEELQSSGSTSPSIIRSRLLHTSGEQDLYENHFGEQSHSESFQSLDNHLESPSRYRQGSRPDTSVVV